ncbi:hypothetical protein FQR65_LT07871 [Abscondita terminalis]|nr:hypothetical protein FQR65_LT07871 [Abscondita terminalis]
MLKFGSILLFLTLRQVNSNANTEVHAIFDKCIQTHNLSKEEMLKLWKLPEFPVDNLDHTKFLVCIVTELGIFTEDGVDFNRAVSQLPKFVAYRFNISLEKSREIIKKVNIKHCFIFPENSSRSTQAVTGRDCVFREASTDPTKVVLTIFNKCIDMHNLPKDEMLRLWMLPKFPEDNKEHTIFLICVLKEMGSYKGDGWDVDQTKLSLPNFVSYRFNLSLDKSKEIVAKANIKHCFDFPEDFDESAQAISSRNCVYSEVKKIVS